MPYRVDGRKNNLAFFHHMCVQTCIIKYARYLPSKIQIIKKFHPSNTPKSNLRVLHKKKYDLIFDFFVNVLLLMMITRQDTRIVFISNVVLELFKLYVCHKIDLHSFTIHYDLKGEAFIIYANSEPNILFKMECILVS